MISLSIVRGINTSALHHGAKPHDEMARDEAKHDKAFKNLLEGYFKQAASQDKSTVLETSFKIEGRVFFAQKHLPKV